jgi:creatinine amidohydrolase/Fe(II)-dependent formamide hydrolase-like protein
MTVRDILAGTALVAALAAPALAQDSVYIEELTWTEIRDAIKAGKTTVILPTGGTEQNGPHMVMGKHNFIIHYTAGEIATRLGNALVGPVVAFVPEGNLDPPSGHMRFPGAITLPEEHYRKLLEFTARSFRVNGFKDVVMIGDSGGNQKGMAAVAEMLNKEWAGSGVRVHFIPEYYNSGRFSAYLEKQGFTKEQIGSHAGITDTSQLWFVNARMIRPDRRANMGGFEGSGVTGDPTKASPELGKIGVQFKIDVTLEALKTSMARRD